MNVVVKAAEGRRVWAGNGPLSEKDWVTVELTGDLVKAIRNGDVIEGTSDDPDVPKIKESLDAAEAKAKEEAEARAEEASKGPGDVEDPDQPRPPEPQEPSPIGEPGGAGEPAPQPTPEPTA